MCWTATAHWLRGDADRCRALAADAMARARRSGDDRALAAAHTVQALVAAHDGDRLANDTHYLRALDHAERAGDVLQIIRIRLNRGSRLNEEGFHDEAIAELDLAIGLADLGGYGSFKAIALCNRGEARGALGRFDEALDDVEGSKAIFQRHGLADRRVPARPGGRRCTPPGARPPSPTPRSPRRSRWPGGRATCRASSPRSRAWPGSCEADDPSRARALADEAVAAVGRRAGRVRRPPGPGLGRPRRRRRRHGRATSPTGPRRSPATGATGRRWPRLAELRGALAGDDPARRPGLAHRRRRRLGGAGPPAGAGPGAPGTRPPGRRRQHRAGRQGRSGCSARSAPAGWRRPAADLAGGRAGAARPGGPVPRRVRRAAERRARPRRRVEVAQGPRPGQDR